MKTIINKISKTAALGIAGLFSTVSPVLAQASKSITIAQPSQGVTDISKLIGAAIQVALVISALLTFFFLIIGGIQWITSGGDKAAYEGARNRITAALIGLAIVAAAYAFMKLIGFFFGIDILTDGIVIPSAK